MNAPTKSMTKAEVREAITAFIKAWNDHDVLAVQKAVTPDVVWTSPSTPGPERVVHGRAAAAADVKAGIAAMPDMKLVLDDLHIFLTDDPQVAFSTWTNTGTMTGPFEGLAPTGKQARIRGICQYRFRDGLIAEHTMSYDRMDMCQQLGLLPYEDGLSFRALAQMQRTARGVRKLIPF
jgi:steroid delta-isomerase-like uncharacterized protein